jgi:hypothetical protein
LNVASAISALGGLIFGCGLPGWPIVLGVFNFIEKNRDAGIDEVAKEVQIKLKNELVDGLRDLLSVAAKNRGNLAQPKNRARNLPTRMRVKGGR